MECSYSTRHARLYTILSVVLQSSIPVRVDVTRKLDFTIQGFARPVVRFRLSARTSSRQDLTPAVIYDLTVRSIRPVDFNFNSFVFRLTMIDFTTFIHFNGNLGLESRLSNGYVQTTF